MPVTTEAKLSVDFPDDWNDEDIVLVKIITRVARLARLRRITAGDASCSWILRREEELILRAIREAEIVGLHPGETFDTPDVTP